MPLDTHTNIAVDAFVDAARQGNETFVVYAIKAGADVNAVDKFGWVTLPPCLHRESNGAGLPPPPSPLVAAPARPPAPPSAQRTAFSRFPSSNLRSVVSAFVGQPASVRSVCFLGLRNFFWCMALETPPPPSLPPPLPRSLFRPGGA
jgi:hypothetical protein